jgi:hypothetical protein
MCRLAFHEALCLAHLRCPSRALTNANVLICILPFIISPCPSSPSLLVLASPIDRSSVVPAPQIGILCRFIKLIPVSRFPQESPTEAQPSPDLIHCSPSLGRIPSLNMGAGASRQDVVESKWWEAEAHRMLMLLEDV